MRWRGIWRTVNGIDNPYERWLDIRNSIDYSPTASQSDSWPRSRMRSRVEYRRYDYNGLIGLSSAIAKRNNNVYGDHTVYIGLHANAYMCCLRRFAEVSSSRRDTKYTVTRVCLYVHMWSQNVPSAKFFGKTFILVYPRRLQGKMSSLKICWNLSYI